MIDDDGYRHNVGIILCNQHKKLFWARRANQSGWQFPQGGMAEGETHEEAMYRELYEEIGLKPEHVELLEKQENGLITIYLNILFAWTVSLCVKGRSRFGLC